MPGNVSINHVTVLGHNHVSNLQWNPCKIDTIVGFIFCSL